MKNLEVELNNIRNKLSERDYQIIVKIAQEKYPQLFEENTPLNSQYYAIIQTYHRMPIEEIKPQEVK